MYFIPCYIQYKAASILPCQTNHTRRQLTESCDVNAREKGRPHQRTRSDHATELAEDYVEAIAAIESEHGRCRVKDLASHFAVSHVTVNRAVARFQRDGLVSKEPYGPVELTARGKRLAKKSKHRHDVVYAFLKKLGISDEVAEVDAEGIEHHVSAETLAVMQRFVESN